MLCFKESLEAYYTRNQKYLDQIKRGINTILLESVEKVEKLKTVIDEVSEHQVAITKWLNDTFEYAVLLKGLC